ncbi:MAG: hypothetical protein ACKO96_16325, partial [Flammeovirgaceae bacterium]
PKPQNPFYHIGKLLLDRLIILAQYSVDSDPNFLLESIVWLRRNLRLRYNSNIDLWPCILYWHLLWKVAIDVHGLHYLGCWSHLSRDIK